MAYLSWHGIEYRFERRRYGKGAFFTWLYWRKLSDVRFASWQSAGDPWPKVRLSAKELDEQLHIAQASMLQIGDRIRLNTGDEARVTARMGDNVGVVLDNDEHAKVYEIPPAAIMEAQ